MSIHHLPRLDPEKWYVINTEQASRTSRPSWQERKVSLHGPNTEASVSWSLLGKYAFGWGFQFGHNGSESDLGLDLYAGRFVKLWLRLRTPWTRWAQSKPRRDGSYGETEDKDWYKARHYGVRIWPRKWVFIEVDIRSFEGEWSSKEPWYRHMKINGTTIWGRHRSETIEGDSGVARIPLPEGVYLGTWVEKVSTTRHVRFPGTLRDRITGPRTHRYVDVKVEGGIPCEGKGENSWDCGMDGVFGTGGATLEEGIGNYVKAVLRNREAYGGPHDLERPMTVQEAEARGR